MKVKLIDISPNLKVYSIRVRVRVFLGEFFSSWTLSWSSACFLERVRFSWTLSWTSACFLHRLLFFSWPSSFFLDWVLFFLVESVVNFLFTFFFSLIKPRLFSTLNFDWNIELFHLKYILKCEKKIFNEHPVPHQSCLPVRELESFVPLSS